MKTQLSLLLLAGVLSASPALADSPFTVAQGANDVPPTSAPPFAHWDLRVFDGCEVPYALGNLTADVAAGVATNQLDTAFQGWQDVTPARIRFRNVGNVAAGSAVDNQNVLFWDNALCSGDAWDPGLRGGAIGITALRHSVVTGIMTDVDIVYDDEHFDWTNGTQNAPAVLGGDDVAAIQTLGDGSRRIVISTGANGICETRAVCTDVQVVAVGVNGGANQVAIRPAAAAVMPPAAPTPLAGSAANLSGQMDIWTISQHEIGHFCGLGENNGAGTTSSSNEGFNDAPFNVPAGATLTFTINGMAVNAALTAGAGRTNAQINADINAAIAAQQPGLGSAVATSTGSIQITATNAAHAIVITGGTAVGLLGFAQESGISTMNQTDPRGLVSLDQRTPSRHDTNGLNFLYTSDLGDAPEDTPGKYQTKVHTAIAGGMLNGVQLHQAGVGAVQWFGHPPYRFEWLGAKEDGNAAECEALVTNLDEYDDGFSLTDSLLNIGFANRVTIRVSTFNPAGAPARYAAGNAARMLYFNGYFDLNNNSVFDPAERLIFWSGVPGATDTASPNYNPGASNLGANPMVLAFDLAVADSVPTASIFARMRLDYGENEGRAAAGGTNGDLNAAVGVAQFGEVEDYLVHTQKQVASLTCPADAERAPGQPVSLHFSVQNNGTGAGTFHYQLGDSQNWPLFNNSAYPLSGSVTLGVVESFDLDISVTPPPGCGDGDVDSVCFIVQVGDSTGPADTCCVEITCVHPVPVVLASFQGLVSDEGVALSFELGSEPGLTGIHVYRRQAGDEEPTRLTVSPIPLSREGAYAFLDSDVGPGATYRYELGLQYADGTEVRAGSVLVSTLPLPFALGPPAPNPSPGGVSLRATLPAAAEASLRVFDVRGRLVRTLYEGFLAGGAHTMAWDGRAQDGQPSASGIYFMLFTAGDRRASQRVLIQR